MEPQFSKGQWIIFKWSPDFDGYVPAKMVGATFDADKQQWTYAVKYLKTESPAYIGLEDMTHYLDETDDTWKPVRH